jgi:hypothetical protein
VGAIIAAEPATAVCFINLLLVLSILIGFYSLNVYLKIPLFCSVSP